ncbi:unnamed protein product [Ilex paraguariensis]|uniref:RING-type E3 ubiquitin transferase n=1 Tax=Ilex paraguariensis TaxID=185542 RepID=A0ABC8SYE9_9AQUA
MANESDFEVGIAVMAIAIDRDKNSHHAVKWAIEKGLKRNSQVILVHVQTQQNIRPQGAIVPKEGRAPTELELQQFFLPYRGICARKGHKDIFQVRAKEVVLHDLDVANALVGFINNNFISTLVVGASSRSALTRAFRNVDVPTNLGRSAPNFCSVYAISSKGKVQNVKLASRPPTPSTTSSSQQQSQASDTPSSEDFYRTYSRRSWGSEGSEKMPFDRSSERISFDRSSERISFGSTSDFMTMTHSPERVPTGNKIPSPQQSLANLINLQVRTKLTSPSYQDSSSESCGFSGPPSFQSSNISYENLDHSYISDVSRSSISFQPLHEVEEEMRRLKLELKQTMEMYNSACKETMTSNQKASEINLWKSAEAHNLEKSKQAQEAALAILEVEKQKTKAAMEVAQMAQRLAELESQKRRGAEMKAKHEEEEKKKVMEELARFDIRYRKYTIEAIEIATSYFSISAKIGEGGYGPVYKALLDHTTVAIKVLRPDISQGQKQFQQEVEVLSRMRHPNMVLLVGACPEYGCLVYEYMENGSLEDRLFRRNNTPTISWRTRFKIASETATALHFFHQTKPKPLVHRDLKPANILLDRNYVSKISDVGLARLVPPSVADGVTQYHMTAAAGTFCYIDPEYQQTGMLGTKSDIYSLGVILLQILTAKPAIGLTYHMERAIQKGTFSEMLDPTVTDWPIEEALSFAKLALQCCELRRKDRPDLGLVILPELNRLRDLG